MSIFRMRIDELCATSAKFYFSSRNEAEAFAHYHGGVADESSPACAGGGLWRVDVPYNTAKVETTAKVGGADFSEAIAAAIAEGSAAIARATQPLTPTNEE